MRSNIQSISENSTFTTPETDGTEQQGTLPVGPTGRVHRGGGVPWHKRLALTKAPSPTAHHVLLVLGSFVSDGQSDAWPSLTTLASMTGLARRTVRTALRALESVNLVTTEHVSGRSSRYRLACAYPAPTPDPPAGVPRILLPGTPDPPAPEGTKEGTSTRKAAAYVQGAVETVEKQSETPRADRNTCPKCGNDWPAQYGAKCFSCNGKRSTAGLAAPEPGKYDGLY